MDSPEAFRVNKDKSFARVHPFKEKELYIFVYCKNERLLVIFTWLSCVQRGLKDTEHKPLYRNYQGVTHAKMIFAVRTLTHAKTLIGRCVCVHMLLSYRSISYRVLLKEYQLYRSPVFS